MLPFELALARSNRFMREVESGEITLGPRAFSMNCNIPRWNFATAFESTRSSGMSLSICLAKAASSFK